MLYVWIGFLKDGAQAISQTVQQQTTEFLKQPYIAIKSAGPLFDDRGARAGMMMIFDVKDRGEAEALVKESPYLKAGLYEDYRLYAYGDEVG